ncbi:MAG: hypothetical protein KGQ70_03945 [Alphaproteobacteria bacterium]|nr:hypothetical protein [Alphaproteobacteria bacterium]
MAAVTSSPRLCGAARRLLPTGIFVSCGVAVVAGVAAGAAAVAVAAGFAAGAEAAVAACAKEGFNRNNALKITRAFTKIARRLAVFNMVVVPSLSIIFCLESVAIIDFQKDKNQHKLMTYGHIFIFSVNVSCETLRLRDCIKKEMGL